MVSEPSVLSSSIATSPSMFLVHYQPPFPSSVKSAYKRVSVCLTTPAIILRSYFQPKPAFPTTVWTVTRRPSPSIHAPARGVFSGHRFTSSFSRDRRPYLLRSISVRFLAFIIWKSEFWKFWKSEILKILNLKIWICCSESENLSSGNSENLEIWFIWNSDLIWKSDLI